MQNESHCTPVCMIPIRCSVQSDAGIREQHSTMNHWSVTTLKKLLVLAVAPRKRYHGERPIDEPDSTMRTICGTYDSAIPTHSTLDSANMPASWPNSQSDMLQWTRWSKIFPRCPP